MEGEGRAGRAGQDRREERKGKERKEVYGNITNIQVTNIQVTNKCKQPIGPLPMIYNIQKKISYNLFAVNPLMKVRMLP